MPRKVLTHDGLERLCLDLTAAEQLFAQSVPGFAAPGTAVRLVGTHPHLPDGACAVEGVWCGIRPKSAHERVAVAAITDWVGRVETTFLPLLNGIAQHLNRLSPGMRAVVRAGDVGACVACHAEVSEYGNPSFRYALTVNSWKARVRSMMDGVRTPHFAGVVHCAAVSGKGLARSTDWLITLVDGPKPQMWTVRAASGEDALLWAAATQDHALLHTMGKCTVARLEPKSPLVAQRRVWDHRRRLFPKD